MNHEVEARQEGARVGAALFRKVGDATHDGNGHIGRVGRHLVDGQLASRIAEGEVDEGAADVDAEPVLDW